MKTQKSSESFNEVKRLAISRVKESLNAKNRSVCMDLIGKIEEAENLPEIVHALYPNLTEERYLKFYKFLHNKK